MEKRTFDEAESFSEVSDHETLVEYKKLHMGSFDIWALGITVVIGGQYFSWNVGLSAGVGSYLIATAMIASMYLCLILCNSELCSAFPFTGGAYGLSRLTLGMYAGFIVACCEAMEYIVYVASSATALSAMLTYVAKTPIEYSLLYTFLFYTTALIIHMKGGKAFVWTNIVLAVISFLIVLLYVCGGLTYVNFANNATSTTTTGADVEGYFIGGVSMFMLVFPEAAWFYVGIESLNLATIYVENPRVIVPRGAIYCMLTLLATSLCVYFVCCSVPPMPSTDDAIDPVATSASLAPFNPVFIRLFNISDEMATILSIPATYATAYGFIFAYGRLIVSMSMSGLFPTWMKTTYGEYQTPFVAQIVGSLIGFIICILVYLQPVVVKYQFNICMLFGFFEYLSQFSGYLIFSRDHGSQSRTFYSPLGSYGAIYGIFICLFGIISISFFQNDGGVCALAFVGTVACLSLYYLLYARHHQQYSPEEKAVYFKCHVREFNKRKLHAINRHKLPPALKPERRLSNQLHDLQPRKNSVNRVAVKSSETSCYESMPNVIQAIVGSNGHAVLDVHLRSTNAVGRVQVIQVMEREDHGQKSDCSLVSDVF